MKGLRRGCVYMLGVQWAPPKCLLSGGVGGYECIRVPPYRSALVVLAVGRRVEVHVRTDKCVWIDVRGSRRWPVAFNRCAWERLEEVRDSGYGREGSRCSSNADQVPSIGPLTPHPHPHVFQS